MIGAPRIPPMFVVYANPDDYPGKFVVRRWSWLSNTGPIADTEPRCVAESLEDARKAIPRELVNIGRHINDDPAIWEVWL